MKEKEWDISSLASLESAAAEILALASEESRGTDAAVLLLHGDLGAGKTTFTQTLAGILKVEETVTSPTFVIAKSYETKHPRFKRLLHVDAYRVESVDELRILGLSEEMGQKDNIICIEWPERAEGLFPQTALRLYFELTATGRKLTLR